MKVCGAELFTEDSADRHECCAETPDYRARLLERP